MATWFDRLTVEHDNLRAALEWCQAAGTDDAGCHGAEIGLRLAAALHPFWEHRGHAREGRAWLERMLARGSPRTAARARALIGAGCMAKRDGDTAVAQACFEQRLALMHELGGQPV